MKVAHLSDVHLGYRAYSRVDSTGTNQRERDVLDAFRRALNAILKEDPSLILITGDLFHTVRPPNFSLLSAYRILTETQQRRGGKPMLIIAGNHETPRSAESTCILALFSHIPGVQVVFNTIEVVDIPQLGVSATCIPAKGVSEIERQILAPNPHAQVNLLLLHGVLEGVTAFALQNPISRKAILREEWDYIALGDYHLYQQVAPNALYSGATEFTSTNIWEEAEKPKGFILYETDTRTHQFHPIKTRQVIDLLPIDAQDLSQQELNALIAERAESHPQFENAIVRQRVVNLHPELRSGIDGALIRELRARALHYQLDLRLASLSARGTSSPRGGAEEAGRLTLRDEWHLFAQAYPLPNELNREEFLTLGERMLTGVEEEGILQEGGG